MPEECIWTARGPQSPQQSSSSLTAEGETYQREPAVQATGAMRVGYDDVRETFGEDTAFTGRGVAEKAAHMQLQPQGNAVSGHIRGGSADTRNGFEPRRVHKRGSDSA